MMHRRDRDANLCTDQMITWWRAWCLLVFVAEGRSATEVKTIAAFEVLIERFAETIGITFDHGTFLVEFLLGAKENIRIVRLRDYVSACELGSYRVTSQNSRTEGFRRLCSIFLERDSTALGDFLTPEFPSTRGILFVTLIADFRSAQVDLHGCNYKERRSPGIYSRLFFSG